ncbi:heavy metal-associated isoprenylated plant protein 2-like [Rutidosis leptorrhynchoides]|uniref:heavy metal-associated isoprenylated plant protein 2-like n=1 Tax=Rutidosis leptorrhynchoides TaxID=125765 RepID=UPI003A99BCF2
MVLKTVLKVDVSSQSSKNKLLKAVSTIEGVDKIEIDATKGTLTITGDADPYEIILRTKKVGKFFDVVSIGPPPPPPKPEAPKKPEEKKKPDEKKATENKAPEPYKAQYHMPDSCPICLHMAMIRYEEPDPACTIM